MLKGLDWMKFIKTLPSFEHSASVNPCTLHSVPCFYAHTSCARNVRAGTFTGYLMEKQSA